MTFEELLTRRMRDYGMSLMELSAEIGRSHDYMSSMLKRGGINVKPQTRREICRVLDIDPEVLDASILESMRARWGQ